jgi:hypothetical protein
MFVRNVLPPSLELNVGDGNRIFLRNVRRLHIAEDRHFQNHERDNAKFHAFMVYLMILSEVQTV